VAAAEDQQPVEALGADAANEALGVGVCLWGADWCVDDADSFAAEDLVEGGRELSVAVVNQDRIRSNTSVKPRLRACWVTQAPVGLLVQPARWTRRLPSSMKKRT
jgi:hypothetical protein